MRSKRVNSGVTALVLLAVLCVPASAQETASSKNAFESFSIIMERNIFNSTRTGLTSAWLDGEAPAANRVRLVGAWLDGSRALAIFDDGSGGRPQTLEAESIVADYVIDSIETAAVTLRRGQTKVQLKVGDAIVKNSDGLWQLAAPPSPSPAVLHDQEVSVWAEDTDILVEELFSDAGTEEKHKAAGPADRLRRRPEMKATRRMRKEVRR